MDKFRWYDWVAVYFVSDIGAALIVGMLSGALGTVMFFPILVLAWLSYENFRSAQHDKEPD